MKDITKTRKWAETVALINNNLHTLCYMHMVNLNLSEETLTHYVTQVYNGSISAKLASTTLYLLGNDVKEEL